MQEELEAQMQMESPDYMKYPANSERLQIVHGSMKMYRRQPKNKKADGRKEFEMEGTHWFIHLNTKMWIELTPTKKSNQ